MSAMPLKTPITNLVTQTEIALSQDRTQKELEDVLYSSLEEYNRMTKMVSDMLFLAQADNNQLIPDRVRFDLRAEVMKVFEFFEAWAEERNIMLLKNIYQGCLTVFIGWIHPDNEKEKAAASALRL